MSKPKNSGELFKHVVYAFYSFSQYQKGFWGQKAVYEYIIPHKPLFGKWLLFYAAISRITVICMAQISLRNFNKTPLQ